MNDSSYWINKLQLLKHPEGGYYRETYRSEGVILQDNLPVNFNGNRNYATAIYFLLESNDFSAFHRIQSDEIWHFYTGSAIEIYVIEPSGILKIIDLGNDIEKGEVFQAKVPANYWFASQVKAADSFALVACTVAPGFDFADFEIANRVDLLSKYPQNKEVIIRLTK